jgi:hypothetical protein
MNGTSVDKHVGVKLVRERASFLPRTVLLDTYDVALFMSKVPVQNLGYPFRPALYLFHQVRSHELLVWRLTVLPPSKSSPDRVSLHSPS